MLCDVCAMSVQPNSSENKDLNSSSVGLRAGWMSVGMSSVSVLDCLHGVGIAWGHSSLLVIICGGWGIVCGGSSHAGSRSLHSIDCGRMWTF